MDLFFADDAQQNKPSRQGMGPLIAIGGVHVPDESINKIENGLDELCIEFGFPKSEPFKWSPGTDLWMRNNLVNKKRIDFFIKTLNLAKEGNASVIVVMEDVNYGYATPAPSRDIDLINLLLERYHKELGKRNSNGIVLVAQPSGDRQDERKFLSNCAGTLSCGTDYVKFERISLSILSSPAKLVRLLQLADLVTSCTTAYISGENQWSPPVFEVIKPLFARETSRIGGVGLKLHPDIKYANLYHWLLGDSHFWKNNMGLPMPLSFSGYKYQNSPIDP